MDNGVGTQERMDASCAALGACCYVLGKHSLSSLMTRKTFMFSKGRENMDSDDERFVSVRLFALITLVLREAYEITFGLR